MCVSIKIFSGRKGKRLFIFLIPIGQMIYAYELFPYLFVAVPKVRLAAICKDFP